MRSESARSQGIRRIYYYFSSWWPRGRSRLVHAVFNLPHPLLGPRHTTGGTEFSLFHPPVHCGPLLRWHDVLRRLAVLCPPQHELLALPAACGSKERWPRLLLVMHPMHVVLLVIRVLLLVMLTRHGMPAHDPRRGGWKPPRQSRTSSREVLGLQLPPGCLSLWQLPASSVCSSNPWPARPRCRW
jgi:hypothetical protein